MFPVLLAEEDYNYFEGYVIHNMESKYLSDMIIKRNKDKQQVYLVTIVSRQDLHSMKMEIYAKLKFA